MGNFEEYFIKEKSKGEKLLDVLVLLSVALVTFFLIIEIFLGTPTEKTMKLLTIVYLPVNMFVFVVFVIDLIRLRRNSKDTKEFFKKNWLDILATIPFGLMSMIATNSARYTFEILKLSRVQKLTRLQKTARLLKASRASKVGKISKQFKAAAHLRKESEKYRNQRL